MRQLVYNTFYTRYQVPFYLRRVEVYLKGIDITKYFVQDCITEKL